MSTYFSRAKAWALAHKAISTLVAVALLSGVYGTFHSSSSATGTSYVLGTVSMGDVVETVSGSGQVAASNDVDVVAKASGAITSVRATVGETIGVGGLIATIDPGDAGLQLKQAQLSYQELQQSKSASAQQAGNSVTSSQQSVVSAYTTARTTILSQDASLSTALASLQNMLANGGYLSGANANAFAATEHSTAVVSAQQASADLQAFSAASASVTSATDPTTLNAVLSQGITAATSVARAAKDAQAELDRIRQQTNNQNNTSDATNAFTTVTSALSSADTALTSLQSAQQGITTAQNNLAQTQTSAQNTVSQSSDLLSAELNIEEKQQAYDNFSVTSPIAGIVAKVDLQVGDQANSGTTVATVLTKEQVAQITLNEVDAAKVKVGDKATLTFDAISDLTLTGTVAEVDLVGTVTQGVVSYGAKITLDASDPRITSGMTVNADIITNSATGVLVVPASAITTANGVSTVRVVPNAPAAAASSTAQTVSSKDVTPQAVEVTTGLTDGSNTQILSGLTEGQTIVVRTESTSKTTAASATTRSTGAGGAVRAGGGNATFVSGPKGG